MPPAAARLFGQSELLRAIYAPDSTKKTKRAKRAKRAKKNKKHDDGLTSTPNPSIRETGDDATLLIPKKEGEHIEQPEDTVTTQTTETSETLTTASTSGDTFTDSTKSKTTFICTSTGEPPSATTIGDAIINTIESHAAGTDLTLIGEVEVNISSTTTETTTSGDTAGVNTATGPTTTEVITKSSSATTTFTTEMSEPRARNARQKGQLNFGTELKHLLHAYGDPLPPPEFPQESLPETVRVLDDIVTDFIIDSCHSAAAVATHAGRQKIKPEDFHFALRHDPVKLGRVQDLLRMEKELKEARKVFDQNDDRVGGLKETRKNIVEDGEEGGAAGGKEGGKKGKGKKAKTVVSEATSGGKKRKRGN